MAINIPIVSKFNPKGVNEARGAFDGMGKALLGIGAIVAGAFSVKAITNFSKEAILAAEAIETSGERIDQIAKSMGIFGDQTDEVTQRLKDYANANEQLFAVDENVIMQTQAKLLTFKEIAESADEMGGAFDRATQIAIDLGAAGFGAAETNAIQLGKALNDPIRGISALTRVGLTFTDEQKEQIRVLQESGDMLGAQEVVLQALEMQVGGVAAATADASVQMGLAFKEIKENVGAALLPAFQTVTAALVPLIQIYLPQLRAFLDDTLSPALMRAADAFAAFAFRVEDQGLDVAFAGMFSTINGFFTGGTIERAFARISEMRQGFVDAILTALPGVIEGLVELLPALVGFITNTLIPQMLAQFVYLVNELAMLLGEIMPSLLDAFAEIVPQLVDSVADLLPMLTTTLLGMVPVILATGISLFTKIVEAVVAITPQLISTIVDLLPQMVKSIVSMLPDILKSAIQLFTAIVNALPIILPVLLKAILDLLPEIMQTVISMTPALIDAAFELFSGIAIAIYQVTPNIIGGLMGLIPQMLSTLLGAIPQLVQAGFEVVSGFARGIINNAPRILGEAIKSIGNTLVNGVKSFLGINSPSLVFQGIGSDVVDGLEKGLGDGTKVIAGASVDMAHTLKVSSADAFSSVTPTAVTRAPSYSSASVGNSISITVNAGMGADGNRIGQQIVDEILKFERTSGRVFARA